MHQPAVVLVHETKPDPFDPCSVARRAAQIDRTGPGLVEVCLSDERCSSSRRAGTDIDVVPLCGVQVRQLQHMRRSLIGAQGAAIDHQLLPGPWDRPAHVRWLHALTRQLQRPEFDLKILDSLPKIAKNAIEIIDDRRGQGHDSSARE